MEPMLPWVISVAAVIDGSLAALKAAPEYIDKTTRDDRK